MKKRTAKICLACVCLALCFCLLAGCGGEETSEESASAGESAGESESTSTYSFPEESGQGESSFSPESEPEPSEEPVSEDEPEESSEEAPVVTEETFAGAQGETLSLYSDGSFLLEMPMMLGVQNQDGGECALVYGYYGTYTEEDGRAALAMTGGYFTGVGMEKEDALASAIAADLIDSGGMDASLKDAITSMLMGGHLSLDKVMTAAEIAAMKKQVSTILLDRENGSFAIA